MTIVKVAALQLGPARASLAETLDTARRMLGDAADQGARLALLPELFAWPYFCADDPDRWREAAQPSNGAVPIWAAETAGATGMALLVPLFLAEPGGRRSNAVLLARPDEQVSIAARKIHLPPRGGEPFGEADHFEPGEPVVGVHEAAGLRIGVLICYDRRFPECWRAARAGDADLVCVPVAGPADEPADFFSAEMRTHARENGVYALSASRCGVDLVAGREVRNDGDTLLAAPDGRVCAVRQQADGPGLLLAEIDLAALAAARARFPAFEQKRAVQSGSHRRITP
jgi:N-carbamoylputrescine amidase